jgi:predicted ATPase/type II secretory pathway predicted ATPase ExeA
MNVLSLTSQRKQRRQQPLVILETTTRSSACGHVNPPEATFCGECGASLSAQSLSCTTCGEANPTGLKFCRSCGACQSAAPARTPTLLSSLSAPRSPSHDLSSESRVQRPESEKSPAFPSQHSALNTQYSVIVGRESELTQLHNVFEKAVRGERQIVFVTGEAGIGKTTLVDAFLAQIRGRADVRITSGQCVEHYGPGEAYMPLLEATQRLCRAPGGERRIEALQRYAPSWLVQLPGLLEPQDRDLLQQRVQGTSRERMLREMAEAAELFATRRGLVLVLEDLHWSDVSTLEWLSYIARRREPAKLMILGTYRPVDVLASGHPLRGVVQELQARRQCDEMRLEPLAEEAIAEYLSERFAVGATHALLLQDLAPLLVRRTGGNPLFVINTVDYFVRQGAVTKEAGHWTLQADKINEVGEGVPDTLRQLIERQVERLSEAEQRLLEAASVAGVEFAVAEAAAGLQGDIETLESQCERLARTGQLLRTEGVAEWPDGTLSGRYSFLHALYHEVVYARVTAVPRVQWHRRIAERKEAAYGERAREIAAELAVHFVEGRDYHKAVQYLQQAGKNAVRRSAHQEAVAHFTRGLDLLATFPDTPERRQHELALQVALGVPLVRTKGYAASEVAHAYGRARELCQQIGEQPELFTALVGLCSFYLVQAELQTARMLAEQCLRLAQHVQDSALLVEAHFILGLTLLYSGELTSAQAILEQGSAFYDPQAHGSLTLRYGQDPGVACRAYASLTRWLLGYPDQALGKNHDALSLARELSHPFSLGATLHTAAWLHQYRQEGPAVQAYAEEEIVVSNEGGFALWLAAGTILRGWALSEQGAREEGLAKMREGMAALNATGTAIAQPYQLALLAQAHGKSGQAHEGLALLDQALAAVDKTGERYYEAELYRLRGELTLAGAGPVEQEAEECFLEAIDVARQQQAKSLELRAVMSLVRLRQQQASALGSLNTDCASHTAQPIARDHLAEARELLEEVYDWFTEGFDSKDLQDAAALLRELGGAEENQQATGNRQQAKIETEDQKQEAPLPSRLLSTLPPQAAQSAIASTHHASRITQDAGTQSSVPSPQSLSSSAANIFHPEGEYWTVSFAGMTCRLKDARGLHYIAHLLQYPHQEVHVITLISVSADPNEEPADTHLFQDPSLPIDHTEEFSDAGEILDPQARAAYKQRLSELREELAEAQNFHDLGRSEQLAAELDFLTHELTSAVGLGGRARRVGSPAERARVNITRAIKLALHKITEHHPALGQHLATTIKTGAYCSYTPDVRMPITWQG